MSSAVVGEPYGLAGKRMPFVGWRYVRPGAYAWLDRNGNNVTVHGDVAAGEARLELYDSPHGIRLVTHAAQRGKPILSEETAWERDGWPVLTTVIQEARKYRAWGTIGNWGDLKSRGESYFCYFESEDGRNWRRPPCGILEFNGSKDNNLLAREGGTVFVDPSAPQTARYKWVASAQYTPEEAAQYRAKRTCGIDYKSNRPDANHVAGIKGATSPDGLRWNIIEMPLALIHSDTQIVAYFDEGLKKYVLYTRDWAVDRRAPAHAADVDPSRWILVGRRSIGRVESEDFRELGPATLLLEPPVALGPAQVLYTNCRTTIPGAPDTHLMFPAVWDQSTDRTHLRLATSGNGIAWNWLSPSDDPMLETAPTGAWDGGCLFALPNLVELPDGAFALPYTGYDVPHKYPRKRARRATGYALWPKGRLAGICADEAGSFATVAVLPAGEKLLVNAVIEEGGSLTIEVADLTGKIIDGYSFADFAPLSADCYKTPARWKARESLPPQAVLFRFQLKRATLYSLDFA
ncbi:MAG TPA: hypothetical protein VF669_18485 [Tepidisphaeraceae bacterium]